MAGQGTPIAPKHVAELLQVASTALRTEMAALREPLLSWHPASGEWCAKEVVGHLIEAEQRGFAGRIRIILSGDSPQLASWDQDQV
ncbi:MAG: hypothetical protein ACREH7_02365, partial [Candidatus Rokuibacteriota bacterium]